MGDEFITLARVLKTQAGAAKWLSSRTRNVPDRFVEGMRLFALDESGTRRSCKSNSCGPTRATWC